jgi:hypothetical protein
MAHLPAHRMTPTQTKPLTRKKRKPRIPILFSQEAFPGAVLLSLVVKFSSMAARLRSGWEYVTHHVCITPVLNRPTGEKFAISIPNEIHFLVSSGSMMASTHSLAAA